MLSRSLSDSYLDAVQQIVVRMASSKSLSLGNDAAKVRTTFTAKDLKFSLEDSSETLVLADVLPLLITDAEVSADILHAFNLQTCLAAPWPGVA
jgi:hypothetical protein